MKYKFKTSDKTEALRLMKSIDMACFIFELSHNLRKRFLNKNIDLDVASVDVVYQVFEEIQNELNTHDINIDELIN